MQKSVIGMLGHKYCGFTLFELLVVLVIIGITISFGLMSLGDFGTKRHVTTVAEQFVNNIHTLQQQAILENSNLGIKLTSTGYQILNFNLSTKQWEQTKKTINLPKKISITTNNKQYPEIIINSLGEINQVKLYVGTNDQPNILQINLQTGMP